MDWLGHVLCVSMAAAQYARPWRRIASELRAKILGGRWQAGDRLPTMQQLQAEYGDVAKGTIQNAINALRDEGLVTTRGGSGIYANPPPKENVLPEPATTPERQPVAVAIVTAEPGVLVGRRNDGVPPWTFIAGEIEPGESPSDAAVREVKEETGLLVRAADHAIGRRVHPRTQRTMIYLACWPTEGTDVHVGDLVELAEVRWIGLAEVAELMGQKNVFGPVWDYLTASIQA